MPTNTGKGYITPVRIFDRDDAPYDVNNRLPVDAQLDVGDIEIGAVEIKNATTDDRAVVTPSGALLVTLTTPISGSTPIIVFNQITIPATTELTLATYTVPVGKTFVFSKAIFGGESNGQFKIRANASILFFARNNAAERTLDIDFDDKPQVIAGGVVDILVYNESNQARQFEATINGSLV